jgi:hypothetical protein
MFVNPERPFHLLKYTQNMAHALISSEPTRVPTSRFCRDPRVLKYLDIYAGQDDLLVEHGSADGSGNLASPLSLYFHLLIILLDLLPSLVARQILISYLHFVIDFYYAWLPQYRSILQFIT